MVQIQMMEEKVYPLILRGELEVDSLGRIWRLKKRGWNRWKKQVVFHPCKRVRAEHDTGVYLMVRAMIDGKRYHAQASRLVYRHFHGPIPFGLTINHKNGNKKDNVPRNLETATMSENILHAVNTLRTHPASDQWGDKNPNNKLSNAQVIEIRQVYAESQITQQALADNYGVAFQTISRIVRGESRINQKGPTGDYTNRRQRIKVQRDSRGRFRS